MCRDGSPPRRFVCIWQEEGERIAIVGVGPTCWGRICAPYAQDTRGAAEKKRRGEHPDIAAIYTGLRTKTNSRQYEF